MKSHNQLHHGSNLIKIISYRNLFQNWPLINYLSPNLPIFLSQLFKSIFQLIDVINFLNLSILN